jgi:hypothetical protein
MSQDQSYPVINLPNLYKNGLVLSKVSNTSLHISVGQCRDSNNVIDLVIGSQNVEGQLVTAPLVLDMTINGANGLDKGSIAASTMYAIYLIGDSRYYQPTACIATVDTNSVPLMPIGYDSMRLIGYWPTNSSSHFWSGTYLGSSNDIKFYYSSQVQALLGGNATGGPTAVPLLPFVPYANSVEVGLQAVYAGATVGNLGLLYNGVNDGSNYVIIYCQVTGVTTSEQVVLNTGPIVSGSPFIDYAVTNSSDSMSLYVTGFSVEV